MNLTLLSLGKERTIDENSGQNCRFGHSIDFVGNK